MILAVVGAILFLITLFLWFRTKSFANESLLAEGIITGFDESNGDEISYAPIVRFTATSGTVVEFTDSVYSNPPGYKIGDRKKGAFAGGVRGGTISIVVDEEWANQ